MDIVYSIIDGIFQKMKNSLIYVRLKDKKNVTKAIKITEKTIFSEMTLSTDTKVLKEKNIKRSDFKEGDQVSVVLIPSEVKPKEKLASVVRRVIVKAD